MRTTSTVLAAAALPLVAAQTFTVQQYTDSSCSEDKKEGNAYTYGKDECKLIAGVKYWQIMSCSGNKMMYNNYDKCTSGKVPDGAKPNNSGVSCKNKEGDLCLATDECRKLGMGVYEKVTCTEPASSSSSATATGFSALAAGAFLAKILFL